MNFNSLEYAVFLLIVVAAYWALWRTRVASRLLLLVASYVFYMSWSSYYAGLILLSTVVDYLICLMLGSTLSSGKRKALLITSLIVNLGLLAVFKYYNFFINSGEQVLSVLGWEFNITRSQLLLPVGISFYTFQTLSYTIDVYRRQLKPETSFLNFAVFVAFFPQLVAGPIVRAIDFLPQMHNRPTVSAVDFHGGLLRIFQGLIKKVVIADLLAALLVDDVFARPREFGSLDQILALYGYAFQIYNDFSGYSDIAIGSAMLLGFRLPENFNQPYLATDIRDFWSRWHITLSTWLRDYLYFPLGGSRYGQRRTTFNLMLTMLLGGLWHGAAMNFVLWGFYHGLLLVGAHRLRGRPKANVWSTLACFHLVLIGWLLFRIESLQGLVAFVNQLVSDNSLPMQASGLYVLVLAFAVVEHLISPQQLTQARHLLATRLPASLLGTGYAMTILVLVGASIGAPTFLYFQF